MPLKTIINALIYNKIALWILLICNLAGTIYGYIWYDTQLSVTDWQFLMFVPDSPTASLFLCLVILAFIANKNIAIIEALAFVSLFKYGVWAVLMNIIMFIDERQIFLNGLMLIFSHGIMAIEAIIFYPRMKVTVIGLVVAMIWVFHNDVIDYIFKQYPYYPFIEQHLSAIAYLSMWLSIIAILLYLWRTFKSKTFDHF
ncbi:DUF1405 domain-containing protein [Staphylococcus durrellii]|uniref:DUF1405 domain-containing protein n=1 Tax=Staphylococcus durrellii TaxID=2781773 RepID=UPI00189F5C6C|nr:DUF1405 domain-containing protein [Staphylococcus durrellii]MBF7017090.1 DUF1405 domain-containing protein [Staphylococcus durrellii]